MFFSRARIYPRWLAKILGLLFTLGRGGSVFAGHFYSALTVGKGARPADIDLLPDNRERLARQIAEEDERAAGAIAVAGLSTLDLHELLDRVVVRMVEVSGAEMGAILLFDEDERSLRPGAYFGEPMPDPRSFRIPLGKGFAGRVASERQPITILDIQRDNTVLNPNLKRHGIRTTLGVPIIVGERLLGVAHVDRVERRAFTAVETRRLQGMAAQAALAIYHALLHQQLEAANRELAVANQRLEAVMAAIPAGVAIIEGPDGQVRAANAAARRLWPHATDGLSSGENGDAAYGLYHLNGEPFAEVEVPILRSLRHGETVVGEEVVLKQPDGPDNLVLLSSAPLRGMQGEVEGAVAVFQDTSGMDLERLKDQFIAVTAHELYTPLTVVKGTAQLLARRLSARDADPVTVEALRMIDGRANWMSYLLQKLVDAAEVQLGPLHLRRGHVDLTLLAEAARRRLQLTSSKHELVCTKEIDRLVGYWDRERIDRVLTNLIENAIKYSPDGGTVEIRVSRVRGADPFAPNGEGTEWAVVRVKDSGTGIPRDQQAHIFRRFYRAGPSQYQESAGLGLGLYVSNRIVSAHSGRIGLESAEGKGSAFFFALPLADDKPATAT